MGKVAPVVLLSLHVTQAAGFVPCPTAVGAHATNPPWAGRMPAGRGARVAAPGYELRLPSSAHAGGALCRGAALSCEAAQRRAVAPLTDVPLGSAALSRGAAWLRRALRALLSVKVLFLASLLGFCLCVAVTPSLAGASPNNKASFAAPAQPETVLRSFSVRLTIRKTRRRMYTGSCRRRKKRMLMKGTKMA